MSFAVGQGIATPKLDPEDIKLQKESLAGIESQAKLWTELVGPITGVATALGLGLKAESIQELDRWAIWAVVVLGVLAILAITASIFEASRAATGGDHVPSSTNPVEYPAILLWRSREAVRGIRRARMLTVIGVLLASLALALTLLGPKAESTHAWVLNVPSATPGAGRVYCGELQSQADSGAYVLIPASSGTALPTQVVTSFANLSQVPNCDDPVAPAASE